MYAGAAASISIDQFEPLAVPLPLNVSELAPVECSASNEPVPVPVPDKLRRVGAGLLVGAAAGAGAVADVAGVVAGVAAGALDIVAVEVLLALPSTLLVLLTVPLKAPLTAPSRLPVAFGAAPFAGSVLLAAFGCVVSVLNAPLAKPCDPKLPLRIPFIPLIALMPLNPPPMLPAPPPRMPAYEGAARANSIVAVEVAIMYRVFIVELLLSRGHSTTFIRTYVAAAAFLPCASDCRS